MSAYATPRVRRFAALTGLTAVSLVTLATAASAHVTANPREAEQGSYAKVSFRVPNERDNAGTTKVQIDLPMDHPLASVSVKPTPGWTVKVEKSKLATPIKAHGGELTEAVSRITWSGGKIEPGQFQEFDVSMGQLPDNTDTMVFKATQTYSGGEVVKWEQPTVEGQEEPEHPAPVLKLVPKGTLTGSKAGAPTVTTVSATGAKSDSADDGTARLLGGLGLAAGVVGIAVGGYGLTRGRSRA